MKKLVSVVLSFLLVFSFASAEVDLSSMSFDELVDIVNKAQLEMMKSDKWQEVTVPEGIYKIGQDIPAGKWTLTAPPQIMMVSVAVGSNLTEDGSSVDYLQYYRLCGKEGVIYKEGETTFVSVDLVDGQYIQVSHGSVIFTPFAGNSFTFK